MRLRQRRHRHDREQHAHRLLGDQRAGRSTPTSAPFELLDSKITDSSALQDGGAIAGIDTNIAVVQSDLEHNQGTGIIYDDAQGGATEVLDSTIANNVVNSAILTGGPATITNSTIANSVGGDGGIEASGADTT